jgi:hypothetical protein
VLGLLKGLYSAGPGRTMTNDNDNNACCNRPRMVYRVNDDRIEHDNESWR